MRLNVPSFSRAGPTMISSSVPFCWVATRAPRGSDGWNVAIPQWKPRPGASVARASGDPVITASAPQPIAFETSPPVRIPPSAMTLQYSPVSSMCCERAAATSAIAVACGTPTPNTPRVVHAAPGPTPTSTPAAPVRIRCSPVWYEAQPPTTIGTGTWPMNSFRFRDSATLRTASAPPTGPRRDVLGRDDGPLDDEDVEPRVEGELVVLAHALRRERGRADDAHVLDLADPLRHQLGLDRRAVDLLHLARRDVLGQRRD